MPREASSTAASRAGATVVPLNVLFKSREVAYHLQECEARAYFCFEGTPELPMAQSGYEAFCQTGDCEDFSILLCSLLRSNGWDTDSVYVIIGKQNNLYHGWVRLIWNDIQYNIEPQGSGFELIIGDMTNLSGYEAICYFNDQEFGTF